VGGRAAVCGGDEVLEANASQAVKINATSAAQWHWWRKKPRVERC